MAGERDISASIGGSSAFDVRAVGLARKWATTTCGLVGRILPSCVLSTSVDVAVARQARYDIRRRAVVVRSQPIPRRGLDRLPALTCPVVDLWSAGIAEVLNQRRQTRLCPACDGEKRIRCLTCGGNLEMVCSQCQGSGQSISDKTGRSIRCRGCRGDGRRRCPCRDGMIKCPSCEGKGGSEEWLDVEETPMAVVRSDGDRALLQWLDQVGICEQRDVAASPIEARRLWTGPLDGQQPAWIAATVASPALRCDSDTKADRIVSVRICEVEASVAELTFEVAGVQGAVRIQAWDEQVRATAGADQGFADLRRRLRWIAAAVFLFAATVAAWYGQRHSYYAENLQTGALSFLALAAPAFVLPAFLVRARPRIRRSRAVEIGSVALALFFGALELGLAGSGDPSPVRAQQLASSGRDLAAIREASALIETGVDPATGRLVHDRVTAATIRRSQAPQAMWHSLASARIHDESVRRGLEQLALSVTADQARLSQREQRFDDARRLLAAVPASFRSDASLREVMLTDLGDRQRAIDTRLQQTLPLGARLVTCAEMRATPLWLRDGEPIAPALVAWKTRIEAKCRAIDLEQQNAIRAREQAARQAQLRAERAAARERERAEREMRDWTLSPLLCRDGTTSPTCVCGGSRRGCCSHHGGVAGCAASSR